ncbi:hypothetical protein EB820_14730 [Brevibacillus agri]|uniref:Uncharacterized protein n=1 Tax=Brevibacillus agri TaxID=51101 RepID=A0A3M8ASH7_9BACL|nr:hypothetical protein BA6348_10815 [Brevibacillus agri]RNB54161.1 hypothetical protein EB820_14730 [Brevibacillus agri]
MPGATAGRTLSVNRQGPRCWGLFFHTDKYKGNEGCAKSLAQPSFLIGKEAALSTGSFWKLGLAKLSKVQ